MPRITITENEKNTQPYRFPLDREVTTFGRSPESDIVLTCGSTSSSHCEMKRVKAGYILEDKGSTNGISFEDLDCEVIDLFDGSEVLIGDVTFTFSLSDEEKETLESEGKYRKRQKVKLPNQEEDSQEEEEEDDAFELPQAKSSSKKESSDSTEEKAKTPALKTASSTATPITPQPFTPSAKQSNGLVTAALIAASIFAGICIRHYMDHGQHLITELMK